VARQLRRSGAASTLAAPARRPAARPALRPDFGARGRGLGQFLIDVRAELRKVVWPTPEQLTRLTALVIAMSVAMGFLLGGVDYLFTEFFRIAVGGPAGP
jgi:preprotein translocase SecE subunit